MENTKKTNDWAEMSDDNGDENETDVKKTDQEVNDQAKEGEQAEEEKPKMKKIPGKKGVKNAQGDYVVTSIDIPDHRSGMKKKNENGENEESDSSSDEGYGDEDDAPVEAKPVEKTKEGKYLQRFLTHLLEAKPKSK